MGYDAFIHIDKTKYTKKVIEDLILMMGYEKRYGGFYCGNEVKDKMVLIHIFEPTRLQGKTYDVF